LCPGEGGQDLDNDIRANDNLSAWLSGSDKHGFSPCSSITSPGIPACLRVASASTPINDWKSAGPFSCNAFLYSRSRTRKVAIVKNSVAYFG
jgi:hypothetical protein